jgi:hypothetical protein
VTAGIAGGVTVSEEGVGVGVGVGIGTDTETETGMLVLANRFSFCN